MKNKLSEKYEYVEGVHDKLTKEQQLINQLIDYLAELTEVVDRWNKQALELSEAHEIEMSKPTPTLKETLLEEIGELKQYQHLDFPDRLIRSLDVEAIINRLIK